MAAARRALSAYRRGGLGEVRRSLERRTRDQVATLKARHALRASPAHRTFEDAFWFATAFEVAGVFIKPAQHESEIVGLMKLVEKEQPRRLLEIGTHLGGSLYLLLHAAPDDAHVVSVDLPFSAVPEGLGWVGYRRSRRRVYRAFTRNSQRLTLIQRSSRDPRTVADVLRAFGGPVDFALIDGWHSYEAAGGDFELYRPLIRPGGIVAFHDIWPGPYSGGVPRLWEELKERYESWELVDDPGQSSFGIGVLRI